jgi:bifunctional UDP-N-acetylglucosamine pyrophosphorylase/glucosamine-1-phosphate N-acetyltransferase
MTPTTHSDAPVSGLILAAGRGTRMRSNLPKVQHALAGRPMLVWVLEAMKAAGAWPGCVVLSEEQDGLGSVLGSYPDLRIAVQKNRLGTGDAVAAAAGAFAGTSPAPFAAGYLRAGSPLASRYILIAAGDVPGVNPSTLRAFVDEVRTRGAAVGVLGMTPPDPTGYGRLVHDGGQLVRIVEDRDADARTRAITLCNTGLIAAETAALFSLLHELSPAKSQREYYLTDVVRHAADRRLKTVAVAGADWREFAGVNDRAQLAEVESWLIQRRLRALMLSGVTVRQPETVYIEADVDVAPDATLYPGCRLCGAARIGPGATIGPGAVIAGGAVGAGACVGAGSVLTASTISAGEQVPPLTVRTN